MTATNHMIALDGAVKKANDVLAPHVALIRETAKAYNEWSGNIPSDLVNMLNKIKKANDDIATSSKKVNDAEKQREQARKREVEDYRRREAAFDRYEKKLQREEALKKRAELATEKAIKKNLELNRSYIILQNSWRNAQKALQDSIATDGLKAESTRRLQKEFDVLDKKIKQIDAATKNYSKNVGNYKSATEGLGNFASQLAGALGWAGAITTAVMLGKSVYNTSKELQILNKSMELGVKDSYTYSKNIEYLNRITEQYGLELLNTSQNYNKFYIAAKNKLPLEQIQLIFEKISKSASLMGLSVADQEGIFRALEQMMSKGTVQAEELRGQLGDRLPGAFEIMAKAVGVSTAELGDLMKEGKIISSEVLPKFAIELERAFGADKVEKIDNVTAAENRLKNTWTDFIAEVNGSENAIGNFSMNAINFLRGLLGVVMQLSSSWQSIFGKNSDIASNQGFKKAMANYEGLDYTNKKITDNFIKRREELKKKEKEYVKEIEKIQEEFDQNGKNSSLYQFFSGGYGKRQNIGKQLDEAKSKLAGVKGELNGMINAFLSSNNVLKDYSKSLYSINNPKEKKKREKKDSTAENRLKAEKEYQLSLLETQKAQAKANDELDLYFTLSMKLADRKREYNLKIAELEIKDVKTLSNKKLEIEQEYISEIIKVNEEEVKEVDKKQNEILKIFEKFYQLRVTQSKKSGEKLRKELENQYDILQLENELNSIGLDQNTVKYYENQRKQLEDWYSYQTEAFKGQTEKLLLIQKEYEAKKKQISEDEKQLFKDFIAQFSSLENYGFGSLDMIFNGQFELIMKGAETLEEKFAAVFGAIGNFAKDAFAFMQQNSDAYFQHEFDSLAKQKELALKYAGENAEGRQMIEEQYDQRAREIKRRQAKEAKAMALFNAAINMAMGITSALAMYPPNIPLSVTIGLIGATQMALIASRPIPEFWKGTSNAPEGLAWTQERGAEVITDRKGNIKTFGNDNGATLTYLNKGDKVYKSQEDFIREMTQSYIRPDGSLVINNNSMSKEDMREIMEDAISKQQVNHVEINEHGFKTWVKKGKSTTVIGNNRVIFK